MSLLGWQSTRQLGHYGLSNALEQRERGHGADDDPDHLSVHAGRDCLAAMASGHLNDEHWPSKDSFAYISFSPSFMAVALRGVQLGQQRNRIQQQYGRLSEQLQQLWQCMNLSVAGGAGRAVPTARRSPGAHKRRNLP